ncbi:hypothetical protein JIN85_19060 [Luteolibacter pohnpeiensis]|uniref:Lipoprotein n=1 Tax=Luteolibacter pohnpeiensis TaxID=454153 RepID=A0A934VYH5_9BACT|nr:hypothetical protein [Luteolibacter pohnpeiensis]
MKMIPLFAIALSAASCYPLPSPTYSVSRYGVDATLVDATSGEPLRRKNASIVMGSSRFEQQTSSNGRIRVAALKNRYWTWLGGPAWASVPRANIVIESEGYKSKRIDWSIFDKSHLPTDDGRIQAGRVIMKNR